MNNGLEIAIIGLAGKFPGAANVTEFWHNLQQGIESIHFYSPEELANSALVSDIKDKANFVNAGGKLADIDLFDGEFFGFSPKEAELLDPQHRLFLETAWTALENAGYDAEQYDGSIGVFGGAGMNGYQFNLFRNRDITQSTSKYELFLASEKDFLTTRVSYKLNLEGPSVNVQTACSTSLVAVHFACQSLLSGECDMALGGGVAISLATGYLHQEGGIYSPDGHCRAFADDAGGTVGGSGVGIVVLKRLEDAIAEKDNILAVIKGSAIDNDGASKVSYTAPRIDTQARVIRAAQLVGEVEPETISYIEAHGTGTSLGDPIEIAALTQAFREETDSKQFCAIGSVKTNIGHLDAAAGIASLIKTVLALQHKQIPPSLNCDTPDRQIDWVNSPFFVNGELKEWDSERVRRAGVSSFGIGGTNAHVVLEEAGVQSFDLPQPPFFKGGENILIISAKTEMALDKATANLIVHLKQNCDRDLQDIAYTLQVGRKAFNYRRMVVCEDIKDAIEKLESKQGVYSNNIEAGYKPVVFMFSGQGSQYTGMAQELYHTEPVFKEYCDRCFLILQPYLDIPLKEILLLTNSSYRRFDETSLQTPEINQTQYAQPAIFTIEYALAQLLIHWGIKPEATIGHSIGEYVAATIAGVFSLEDALKLVANRAHLMQQQPTGVMLSVAMSVNDTVVIIHELSLQDELSIAVVNTPELCVVSGTEKAIAQLENILTDRGVACRRLKTSHGFHSHLMDGAVQPFIEEVKQVKLHPPQIPFISNVTGNWITDSEATNPEYWGQQIRATVQFAKGIETITTESDCILLEVGAGKTLTTLAKQISPRNTILASIPHIKQKSSLDKGDLAFILNTCGQLWLSGVKLNWSNFYPEQPYRLPLPTYPFERKRYWVEAQTELLAKNDIVTQQERAIDDWFYLPSWSRDLPIVSGNSAKLALESHSWLILQDNSEISQSISDKFSNIGCQIITVTKGREFVAEKNDSITINPQDSSHYIQLFDYLKKQNIILEQIIYFWELDKDISEDNKAEKIFTQFLFLAQALGKQQIDTNVSINILTSNLFDLNNGNKKSDRHIITALIKVINQEYSDINICLRDINFKISPDNLLSEIVSNTKNSIVAYRGKHRWLPEYKPYQIQSSENTLLQQQGVYLIIGDLKGGLGKVWAEYLIKEWQAKLILIDRDTSSLESDIVEEKELAKFDIDINNEVDLRNAIAKIKQDYSQINGVFFSTPMTNKNSASLIQEMNLSHWQYNYETKIKPIQVLDKCLQDISLDFVCIQSSLSSILGGIGLAAYASANAYLDAFVEQKNNESNNNTLWFSINWDACQKESNNSKGIGASLQKYSLTAEEIGAATARILSLRVGSQIVVSKGDLSARIKQWLTPSTEKDRDRKIQKVNNIVKHSRPNLTQKYVAPRNETEQEIATIWQQVLGIDKVGIYDPFFELGGHSLLAIQTISRLRESFQVELPMSSILADTPTVANLAETIIKQQPQDEEMAIIGQLLDEVTNLSPEEIAEQLNSQNSEN